MLMAAAAAVAASMACVQQLAQLPKQHTSTVALVPPEEAWPPIQATRIALRDKGMHRWPPHINLLYPFLPPSAFDEAVAVLAPAIAELAPFSVTLDSLDTFGGRARGVLYCHPSSEGQVGQLRELQAALQSAVPSCHEQQRGGTFTPHMTLAHFESREAAEAAREELARAWAPVTFDCSGAVHLMLREGGAGQFARAATLPLGAVAPERFSPPRRWDSMPAEEEGWMREARLAAMVQSGRRGGRSGRGSRRRPRRSAEERAAIAARTPEEIAQIRAERAAKRAARGERPTGERRRGLSRTGLDEHTERG